MPALFTSTSGVPNVSNAAATDVSSVMSPCMYATPGSWLPICTSSTPTRYPAATAWLTISAPMPCEPPVTRSDREAACIGPYRNDGVITLTTYTGARAAFRSRDLRQALYDEGAALMTGVIVNLHGDEHVARRRVENRLFGRETSLWFERERIPDIVAQVIRGAIRAGRGELIQLARRSMMTLSIGVAGVDFSADTEAEFQAFYDVMDRLARASTVVHATGDKAAIVADGVAALTEFRDRWYVPSLERRIAATDPNSRDVLSTLLRHRDELDLPDDTLLREIAYFPWVGSHSTSNQFVHLMHHVFQWLDDRPADRGRLSGDPMLLQRFVSESLRLHPASPVAFRIAVEQVVLPDGITIESGESVAIGVAEANRDPTVFGPDADEFDPFRTVPDDVDRWGLSFGHGPHACLGRSLAGGHAPDGLAGAIAVMATTLLNAGVRPDPQDPACLDTTTSRVVWGRYPVLVPS